jgi:hypothetical protein
MPQFIYWFLNRDQKAVSEQLGRLKDQLHARSSWMQNSDRISYNMALNHLAWNLFVSFVYDLGVCSAEDKKNLIAEHFDHCVAIQDRMLSRCKDEQNGQAFLRILLQLIYSREVIISGFNDDVDGISNRPIIGFVTKSKDGLPVANLLPDTTFNIVKTRTNANSPIRGTAHEFARQFYEGGLMVEAAEDRLKKQVRNGNVRVYVWPLNMLKIGLGGDEPVVIQGGKSTQQQVDTKDLPQMLDGTTF